MRLLRNVSTHTLITFINDQMETLNAFKHTFIFLRVDWVELDWVDSKLYTCIFLIFRNIPVKLSFGQIQKNILVFLLVF